METCKFRSLWLEKVKDEKENNLNLKCKACIKFEDEINGLSTFKKTWIDGYSGGRLVSLKDHCNSKSHMKALRSFKASVDTSVSPDEFKRLKRNTANIAYFAAKNDISFRKPQVW